MWVVLSVMVFSDRETPVDFSFFVVWGGWYFLFTFSLASLLAWVVYFVVYLAAPFALVNMFSQLPIKKKGFFHPFKLSYFDCC